jgi:glycosyltransferase involved in cell wall biosynthesis
MGRLTPQKGFDLLINAFSQVATAHSTWELRILGEGEDLAALQRHAADFGIADRVQFLGWMDDPNPFLANASLFVLASRWEGFPNALLQAMAHGAAVIGFACDSGPEEIIRQDVDGLLVLPEDVGALAAAMDRLMGNLAERTQLGQRAREVTDRFSCHQFFSRWDRVVGLRDDYQSE